MVDVDEVYKVPSSQLKQNNNNEPNKTPLLEESTAQKPASSHKQLDLCTLFSDLNLFKSGRFNVFERHVNQLVIRGDNVVTVALADL